MGAIYILWLRELKRYIRSRVQIIVSLGQPCLYLLALGFGLGPVFQKAGQGSYLQFMAPGVIGMTVLFSSVFSGIAMLWDRQFGFLKETLVAPVSRMEIMVGRTLGGATVAVIQGTLILIICLIAGFRPHSWLAIPIAFLFVVMIAIVFAALGTAIGSVIKDMQGFQLVMNFLVMPIFFLSGALFPLANLPLAMSIITKLDPLSYGVDGLRGALINNWQFSVGFDIALLAVIGAVFLSAGAYLFSERGIDATSMDAIAEASGVSKATIYKHWPDKDALSLEVMGYLHGLDEEPPVFDSGDFRADLIAQLQYQPATDPHALT